MKNFERWISFISILKDRDVIILEKVNDEQKVESLQEANNTSQRLIDELKNKLTSVIRYLAVVVRKSSQFQPYQVDSFSCKSGNRNPHFRTYSPFR